MGDVQKLHKVNIDNIDVAFVKQIKNDQILGKPIEITKGHYETKEYPDC